MIRKYFHVPNGALVSMKSEGTHRKLEITRCWLTATLKLLYSMFPSIDATISKLEYHSVKRGNSDEAWTNSLTW